MKKYKGFTLVELMIVIAIIGILSAILYPSLTGYFERARDTKKKAEIRILENAFIQKYIDTGIYKIPGTGYNVTGIGYINLNEGAYYTKSIIEGLEELGYIKKGKFDIYGQDKKYTIIKNSKNTPCSTNINKESYLFYTNENRYIISTYLERATNNDKEYIQTLYNSNGSNGTCSRYGHNYGVGN